MPRQPPDDHCRGRPDLQRRLARLPGNVLVPAVLSGLTRDSVVNTTALATVDRAELEDRAGAVPTDLMDRVDDGLRLVLSLRP